MLVHGDEEEEKEANPSIDFRQSVCGGRIIEVVLPGFGEDGRSKARFDGAHGVI
jgi:hypothetical protein